VSQELHIIRKQYFYVLVGSGCIVTWLCTLGKGVCGGSEHDAFKEEGPHDDGTVQGSLVSLRRRGIEYDS
jgi:hypothetical protein